MRNPKAIDANKYITKRIITFDLFFFLLEAINEPIIAGGILDVKKKTIVYPVEDRFVTEVIRIIIKKPGANIAAIKRLVFVAQVLSIKNKTTKKRIPMNAPANGRGSPNNFGSRVGSLLSWLIEDSFIFDSYLHIPKL